jgi:hypothetical protein
MTCEVTLARGDEWEAVYANGEKIFEHHNYQWSGGLSRVIDKYGPITKVTHLECYKWIETYSDFPERLINLHDDSEKEYWVETEKRRLALEYVKKLKSSPIKDYVYKMIKEELDKGKSSD